VRLSREQRRVLRLENGKSPTMDLVDQQIELVSWSSKSSLLAESFRTILTSILFSGQHGEQPRVVVFTSASPNEGKTTIVSNLGISLAEINYNALIIDADMRKPRLHTVFNLSNDRGLCDLLLRDAPLEFNELESMCLPTAIPHLYVLPSGNTHHNASSVLHSPRLPELLKLVRQKFDMVLVDTPPLVNLADARVIARCADGVILVLKAASTTRDAALLAKRRLAEDGISMLGAILNCWNPKVAGNANYSYYYSGYREYYGKDKKSLVRRKSPSDDHAKTDVDSKIDCG
jgi:succinoglycan biosynthesis transport protein ExoP